MLRFLAKRRKFPFVTQFSSDDWFKELCYNTINNAAFKTKSGFVVFIPNKFKTESILLYIVASCRCYAIHAVTLCRNRIVIVNECLFIL